MLPVKLISQYPNGETGKRIRPKIWYSEMSVRVRLPLRVHIINILNQLKMKNIIVKENGKEKKLRLTLQQLRYMMNNCKKNIIIKM